VRQMVLVDNGSTDGTPATARRIAAEHGYSDRLEVKHYPFSISRCGPEHLGTPADSVHNLAYYYNWSFSHVRTTFALKWDADMVLSDDAVEILRDLEWQLEAGRVIIRVPRYPTYLSGDDRVAFLDTGLRNNEPWGWPNLPGYSFVKAMEWEMPLWGRDLDSLVLPDWGCVELKFLDEDEFGHWTDTNFERSARQKRKQREYEVFRALNDGAEPPEDVVKIVAPEGGSVVEHIRTVWLPERAREELSLVTV
jgi:glycosyltransferase involved in cell wall biosynthesis